MHTCALCVCVCVCVCVAFVIVVLTIVHSVCLWHRSVTVSLVSLQAFLWSLDYWQKRLGNTEVSVGAVVFDGCDRRDQLIQNLLGFEQVSVCVCVCVCVCAVS